MVAPPEGFLEFLIQPWPVKWGYLLGLLALVAALPQIQFRIQRKHWPLALLLFWFVWVLFSNAQSISPRLSNPTVLHFTFCLLAYILGFAAFRERKIDSYFWLPLVLAFGYALFAGFDQHNGGLEATRRAFYAQPDWQSYPPEFILKIQTNRIFSTLVYPNAFAGAILLLAPILVWKLWEMTLPLPRILRAVLCGLYGYIVVADLYWTGSKGGWLIALLVLGLVLIRLKFSPKIRAAILIAGVVLGLGGFFYKFSGYFKKGAPSLGARFTYWNAALQVTREHPLLGTGPGTFQVPYARIKPKEAEMAKLVHSDYLEQASDSGIPAFLAFFGFTALSLYRLYRHSSSLTDLQLIAIGEMALLVQGTIEFTLYIPGLAWTSFFFLGYLWSIEPGSVELVKKDSRSA